MALRGNDDDDMVLIEQFGRRQSTIADFDGERNLSINCNELRYLRRYLLLVGQWYPKEWSLTKRAFYHVWQFQSDRRFREVPIAKYVVLPRIASDFRFLEAFIIYTDKPVCVTVGVWVHFVYSLNLFGDSSGNEQYFKWFPISAIEQIIWESRWVISHHLGLYYFCVSRHMENFLQESCLNQALWRETSRYLQKICVALVVLIFVIPVLLRPVELSYSFSPGDTSLIIMDTVGLGLDRLVTAPIFLVFVFEAYVLVRVVKGYEERIKTWPKDYKSIPGSGLRAAKIEFIKINSLISSVGSNFQVYLALHFLFLLITAFLGVFACVEQLETKITQNHTYYTAESPRYYKRIKIAPSLIQPPVKIKMVPINKANQPYLQNLLALKTASKDKIPKELFVNVTLKEVITKSYAEASEQQMLIEVGIEAILKILESVVLYMIPLTLLLRLQRKLSIVQQTIQYSDCFEQEKSGFLFQDEKTIKIMAKFVETCRGITIFGYKMPLFRVFLLSVFAPFLTALTTFLFSYIQVKKLQT